MFPVLVPSLKQQEATKGITTNCEYIFNKKPSFTHVYNYVHICVRYHILNATYIGLLLFSVGKMALPGTRGQELCLLGSAVELLHPFSPKKK